MNLGREDYSETGFEQFNLLPTQVAFPDFLNRLEVNIDRSTSHRMDNNPEASQAGYCLLRLPPASRQFMNRLAPMGKLQTHQSIAHDGTGGGGIVGCANCFSEPVSGQTVQTLGVDIVFGCELIFLLQPVMGGFGDLDFSRFTRGFQAAGEVDGFAPNIVGKPLAADHAGDHWSRADTNPELD